MAGSPVPEQTASTMSVRIFNQDAVRRLLPMSQCIEVMERALGALAAGAAVQPLRCAMPLPGRAGLLGVMPGFLGEPPVLGIKVLTVFPGNAARGLDSHQGAVLLFDPGDGRLLAIMDATEITAIRTAAVSAVATRHLARRDAGDLVILGTGTQAETHLESIALVRPLRRIRVWARDPRRCERFAERATRRGGPRVEPAASARDAARGADIICTVTASREPVLMGQWIEPGAHVNAVGACVPAARELDTAAVVRGRLFCDRRESALHEAGDLLIPIAEGALTASHIAGELGDVLLGRVTGRTDDAQVTIFKSLGLAVEDLAAAIHIYGRAAAGDATDLDLGGHRR